LHFAYTSALSRGHAPGEQLQHALTGRESLPVGRPDFKPGEGCLQFCVGSTPTLFRQSIHGVAGA